MVSSLVKYYSESRAPTILLKVTDRGDALFSHGHVRRHSHRGQIRSGGKSSLVSVARIPFLERINVPGCILVNVV